MNRSNVGNVVTNGVQTLNISGTTASAMIRKRENASTALNAQKIRDDLLASRARKEAANAELAEARVKGQNTKNELSELKKQQEQLKVDDTQSKINRRSVLNAKDELAMKKLQEAQKATQEFADVMDGLSEQGGDIATNVINNVAYGLRRSQEIPSGWKEYGGLIIPSDYGGGK